jgi:hypothetical protein
LKLSKATVPLDPSWTLERACIHFDGWRHYKHAE